MVGYCVAYNCKEKAKKGGSFSFHSFPKDDLLAEKWVQAMHRKNFRPTKYSRICSKHFTEDSFVKEAFGFRKLTRDAVPTMFDFPPNVGPSKQKSRKPPLLRETPHVIISSSSSQKPSEITSETRNETSGYEIATIGVQLPADENTISNNESENEHRQNKVQCLEEASEKSPIRKRKSYIGDFTSTDMISPKKAKKYYKLTKEKIIQQKGKIGVLQKANARLKYKVENLTSLLKILQEKNLLSDNATETLTATVPETAQQLFAKMMDSSSQQKFPTILKSFALTLNFYSPKAYDFVRNTFNKCLPHPETLRMWYSSVGGGPGFTEEIKKSLTLKARASPVPLVCSLIVDEMAIHRKVEWTGKKLSGLIDYGTNICSDALPEAKDVLVFLVNCLNERWKMPVGYFCINGLSGRERANLVLQCLKHIHDTGIIIASLTCDGTSCNLAMAGYLGCDLSYALLKTWFSHPVTNEPVFFFLDACHMLKLVRNTLASMCLFDDEGNCISWSYLENLVAIQEKEGLHIANKLRRRHLLWKEQKMKVKLAAQTLSNSVAVALQHLESSGMLQFKDCGATVTFIKIMNDIFDFLNSRNLLAKGTKACFLKTNEAKLKEFADNAEKYIATLRQTKNGDVVLKSARKTGFLGFIVSMRSFVGMFNTLVQCEVPKLNYLMSYKMSQDHLEVFFSAVRCRGGNNNNPTARQFEGSYKRLLVHTQVSGSKYGNCTDLENITILNVGQKRLEDDSEHNLASDDDYSDVPDFFSLSDFVCDVVAYIAGFVVKKLKKTVQCDICSSTLYNDCPVGLVAVKNFVPGRKGGLISASEDVIYVCKMAEATFRYTEKKYGLSKNNILSYMTITTLSNLKASVFSSIEYHMFHDEPLDNHIVKLIKVIIIKYLNIRMHHATVSYNEKVSKKPIRSKLTKLILFQHQ